MNIVPAGLMKAEPHPAALKPFRMDTCDLIGPLPRSYSVIQVFVFIDICTKSTIAVPLRKATAKVVADAMLANFIFDHGGPEILLVDNGTHFTGGAILTMCDKFNINLHFTSRYFPRTNPTERYLRTIKTALAV